MVALSIQLGFLTGLMTFVFVANDVSDPLPYVDVPTTIARVHEPHFLVEEAIDQPEAMNIKTQCDIIRHRKYVVQKNFVIVATSDQEAAVRRKSETGDLSSMPAFVFLDQQEWFKATA